MGVNVCECEGRRDYKGCGLISNDTQMYLTDIYGIPCNPVSDWSKEASMSSTNSKASGCVIEFLQKLKQFIFKSIGSLIDTNFKSYG